MKNSKRGMLPPYIFFCIMFVSRIVVTLTFVQGVSVGKFGSDVLISIAVSMLILIILSIPTYLCVKKGITPFNNRVLSVLFSLYFCFFCAITISRFAYFASSRMNTELSMIVVIVMISVSMLYGAYLGFESIGRFGFICAVLLAITLLVVLGLNAKNIFDINFYPLIINDKMTIINNSILFAANSVAPAYLLVLSSRVNGNSTKPYFISIVVSYLVIFVLVLFCIGVMGDSAQLQSYPIYSLFQLASIGTFSRLDMLHTAFWILSVLLKCSLLIYCASICVPRLSHTASTVTFSIISGALALFINELVGTKMLLPTKIISLVLLVLFSLAFPLYLLIVRRKNEKN